MSYRASSCAVNIEPSITPFDAYTYSEYYFTVMISVKFSANKTVNFLYSMFLANKFRSISSSPIFWINITCGILEFFLFCLPWIRWEKPRKHKYLSACLICCSCTNNFELLNHTFLELSWRLTDAWDLTHCINHPVMMCCPNHVQAC